MPSSSHSRRASSLEKGRGTFSINQGELFPLGEPAAPLGHGNAPNLDLEAELLGALKKVLREADKRGLSRPRVVDRMNLCLKDRIARGLKPITKRQLDCWTAESKEYHPFPLLFLPAFCWATETELVARITVETIGFDLIDAHEAATKRLGETLVESARLKKQQGALLKILGSRE